MIELYKIFVGKYDNKTAEWIAGKCIEKRHDTRNHCIATVTCSFDMRINLVFFSNRIIPIWTSLPD